MQSIDRLSRNVGMELPSDAAQNRTRT